MYNPAQSGKRMTIVCFISGSGTNYREIVNKGPDHHYLVFTNRPGCPGVSIARSNKHEVIELSHIPFLKEARKKYGPGKIPRNSPERLAFERTAVDLIESRLGRQPDLICLAGYDQWNTDWFVDRYYPRILNVHPGDITKGYTGLHWVPSAKAILAGEKELRSTLFFVDKNMDAGPVLAQSLPVDIDDSLTVLEKRVSPGLHEGLARIKRIAAENQITTYQDFLSRGSPALIKELEIISSYLQDVLKVGGDWKIYPFGVHELIAAGRVEVDGRDVYVDGKKLPPHGYRPDENR